MILLANDKIKHQAVRAKGALSPENHYQVGLAGCGLLLDSPPKMI